MEREAIQAFVRRDRAAVEAAKGAYHARRCRDGGPGVGFATGAALWEHVRRVRPDWPTAADRAADLEHHVALKGSLDRAAPPLARR